jgi:AcrR family transcriptional regulator
MTESARHRGQQTQSRILERAVHLSSVRGLENMSLAHLADAAGMSKSGLFAHFRSKEALQVAIVDEADRLFRAAVVEPAGDKRGRSRLEALTRAYVAYMGADVFEGGCFFAAALHEFDSRPGPVRDRLVQHVGAWHGELRRAAADAADARELAAGFAIDDFLFSLEGIALAVNLHGRAHDQRERWQTLAGKAVDALLAGTAR